jgi:ethanolamine ammonia-lyase large subunit
MLTEARGGSAVIEARCAIPTTARRATTMYLKTGQGSALSANANHGCDHHNHRGKWGRHCRARHFKPLLVNTVVASIGLLSICSMANRSSAPAWRPLLRQAAAPMYCDIRYTNHAEADSDDMDA